MQREHFQKDYRICILKMGQITISLANLLYLRMCT